jgi:antirestriction protein ArdC
MGHSTMHPKACDRKDGNKGRFGSKDYAYEELIAELTAVFAAAYLGCDLGDDEGEHAKNHAAYLQSWLKKLKSDTSYIYRAAAEASKACDYIIDRLVSAHHEYTRDHTAESEPKAA